MDDRLHLEQILMNYDVTSEIQNNIDYLTRIIPEIKLMINFPQNNPYHHLDVFNHTLKAIEFSPRNILIRLTLLFHDIGKPLSYQDDYNMIRHFKNHQKASAIIADTILRRLGYKDKYIKFIKNLILNHDNMLEINQIKKCNDKFTLYKIYALLTIQKCDILAHHPNFTSSKLEKIKKREEIVNLKLKH